MTEAGISTLTNELHPSKARRPMMVGGMAMLVNELHEWKASRSMLVGEGGIATFANSLHPSKALLPRAVTDAFHELYLSSPSTSSPSSCGAISRMEVVPSGMAKCTPFSDDGAAATDIVLAPRIYSLFFCCSALIFCRALVFSLPC